ncbi:DUF2178 domain-containing protein [Alkalicella caledoniensis]|uniref:DUF2178 domain-containing protein n=1 Tax=Alkalicella caledoniensis TaxID=2731377 RepID=A0A7G9W819_ALKCA|nr:DUF2178 domain-containing protein [Alkalicella caledoniensis]QNO14831.1 DUF2178 domain-containing protein [Alkalicella caledoniensis]
MENKLKKYRFKRAIFQFVAFAVGYELYSWLGSGNDFLRFLSGGLFSFITIEIYYTYILKKNPKVLDKEKHLENDERIKIIKEKAANSTLVVILVLLVGSYISALIMQLEDLHFYLSILIGFIVILNKISRYYWNSKI